MRITYQNRYVRMIPFLKCSALGNAEEAGATVSDRDFQAEFDELIEEFVAARRQAIEKEGDGTPEAIAQAETAKANWRIVKEQIKDLLDEWVEEGGLTDRPPE